MSVLDSIANWFDRRESSMLRAKIAQMEAEQDRFAPRLAYLNARDKFCSEMANTINRQAFEIAQLKGVYDLPTDEVTK